MSYKTFIIRVLKHSVDILKLLVILAVIEKIAPILISFLIK